MEKFTYTTDEYGVIHQEPPTITAVYDKKYVSSRYDSYGVKTRAMAQLRLGFILRHLRLPLVSEICDVGYGNGEFLKTCIAAGHKAFGIDVSDYPPPEEVRRVDASAITWEWDLLTFFDSLEHIPDLSFIRSIKARRVCITVPYCRFKVDDPDFLNWKHLRPGEHLHHFSPYSLTNLLGGWYKLIKTDNIEDAIRGEDGPYANTITMLFELY